MWSSAMLMDVSESMMMLFMPLVRALTMVVNAVFILVYEGLIVNADVGLELDHGLDQVIQAVIDHVNGGSVSLMRLVLHLIMALTREFMSTSTLLMEVSVSKICWSPP